MIVRFPVRAPAETGANRTLSTQAPPAGRLDPQLFVWVKSPVTVTPVIGITIVELFVRVTVLAALLLLTVTLPKFKAAGDTLRFTTPEPVSGAVCGLVAALSAMVSVPDRAPIAEGKNLITILHDFDAPKGAVVLQVLVLAIVKSPPADMLDIISVVA